MWEARVEMRRFALGKGRSQRHVRVSSRKKCAQQCGFTRDETCLSVLSAENFKGSRVLV
jgi:hypothetical protein